MLFSVRTNGEKVDIALFSIPDLNQTLCLILTPYLTQTLSHGLKIANGATNCLTMMAENDICSLFFAFVLVVVGFSVP